MSFPVTDFQQSSKDYRLVEQAIMYLENHAQDILEHVEDFPRDPGAASCPHLQDDRVENLGTGTGVEIGIWPL